jgi:prolipoprotein diacylglyceryltransferase
VLELTSNYLPTLLQLAGKYMPFVSLVAGVVVSIYAVARPIVAFIRREDKRIGVLIRTAMSLAAWMIISYAMANVFLIGLWLGAWETNPRDQSSADKGQLILVVSNAVYSVLGALLVFWVSRYGKHKPAIAADGA